RKSGRGRHRDAHVPKRPLRSQPRLREGACDASRRLDPIRANSFNNRMVTSGASSPQGAFPGGCMAGSARTVQRLLQAAWLRPLIFLLLLIGVWDGAIRVFHIPPYQIPAPYDVLVTLWQEWPKLLSEAGPTTLATVEGFLLSAAFGIPVAMAIAGSRT